MKVMHLGGWFGVLPEGQRTAPASQGRCLKGGSSPGLPGRVVPERGQLPVCPLRVVVSADRAPRQGSGVVAAGAVVSRCCFPGPGAETEPRPDGSDGVRTSRSWGLNAEGLFSGSLVRSPSKGVSAT